MNEVSVPLPDLLWDRLKRLAAPMGLEVSDVLGRVIAESVPSIPDGLPESIRAELEALESFSDEALKEVALSFVHEEDLPEFHSGGSADLTMLRKAYANVLLQWRGRAVTDDELEAATCRAT